MTHRIPRDEFESRLMETVIRSHINAVWGDVYVSFRETRDGDPLPEPGTWRIIASRPDTAGPWENLFHTPQVEMLVWIDDAADRPRVAWSMPPQEHNPLGTEQSGIDARPWFGWE